MSGTSITSARLGGMARTADDSAVFRFSSRGELTTAPRGLWGRVVQAVTGSDEIGTRRIERSLLRDMQGRYGDDLALKAFRLVRPDAFLANRPFGSTRPITARQVRELEDYAKALGVEDRRGAAAEAAMRFAPEMPGFARIATAAGVDPAGLSPNQTQLYKALLQHHAAATTQDPVTDKAELRAIAERTLRQVADLEPEAVRRTANTLREGYRAGENFARMLGGEAKPHQLMTALLRFQRATGADTALAAFGQPSADAAIARRGREMALAQAVAHLSPRQARALFEQATAPGGTGRHLLHAAIANAVFTEAISEETDRGLRVAEEGRRIAGELEELTFSTLVALGEHGGIGNARAQVAELATQSFYAATKTLYTPPARAGAEPTAASAAGAREAGLKGADDTRALYGSLREATRTMGREAAGPPGAEMPAPAPDPAAKPDHPYLSRKQDAGLRLNGQALMNGNADPVVCRHLATWWEQQFIASDRAGAKLDYGPISSADLIARNVPPTMQRDFEGRVMGAATSIVGNADWGREIADRFREMERDGETAATIHLLTADHAMAIGLKIRQHRDPETQALRTTYVAHFYDPNLTATHRRAAVDDPAGMERFGAVDFLGQQRLAFYLLDRHEGRTAFIGGPAVAGEKRLERLAQPVTPQAMNHMLFMDLDEDLDALRDTLAALSPKEQFALLAARGREGQPGFYPPLQDGHGASIEAYGRLLQASSLTPAQKTELLAARRPDGTPGLLMALQNGRAGAVRAFTEVVRTAGLTEAQQVELLAAKTPRGMPGLHMAMHQDQMQAIAVFGAALRASGLPPARQAELLAAKRQDGSSGLCAAFHLNMGDAVRAFGEVVDASGLETAQKMELLTARRPDGVPGLNAAVQEKSLRAIRSFGDFLGASGLTPEQKVELLTARGPDGRTAYQVAMAESDPSVAQAFRAAVRVAGLTEEQQNALLRPGVVAGGGRGARA